MYRCALRVLVVLSFGSGLFAQTSDLLGVFDRTAGSFELQIVTIAYDEGSTPVRLAATERLPGGEGRAEVSRRRGATQVEVRVERMKPAWAFGGDFNTYVLWALSPEGRTDNLGEFILNGNNARLNASTPMDVFALVVSAEPHFLVERPSPFVVLASREPDRALRRPPETVRLELAGPQPGYRYETDTLAGAAEARGEVRSFLRQAHVALQLAARAEAGSLAPEEFRQAADALQRAEGAAETRSSTHPDVEMMARGAIRFAARAQSLAVERGRREGGVPAPPAIESGGVPVSDGAPVWFRLDAVP